MTVEEMLADLYQEFSHPLTPPPPVRSQFLAHLNKGHRAILREPGLERLRPTLQGLRLATEPGRALYGLPAPILRVTAVTDRVSGRPLDVRDLIWLRATDPGLTSSGAPDTLVPIGQKPIARAPASTGIWVQSDSAADVSQTLYLNGLYTDGGPSGDLRAALAGVTPVRVGLGTFVDVTSVVLNGSCEGRVTLTDAATGGHVLAEIAAGQIEAKYFCVQFHPTPSAVADYYVDGLLPIVPLGDRDTPMLPEEFHDLLVAYARMREYEYKGDTARFQASLREYTTGLSRLRTHVNSQPAQIYVLGRPVRDAVAREGPWFPATW